MPALPAVPGVVRADLHFAVGADLRALSRFKFSYTGGPPTAANLNALATAMRTAWTNRLAGATETGTSLTSVVVQDLSSNTGAVGSDVTSVAGTRSGGQLPAQTCGLINHTIARRYRGGKPRTYLPAGTATDMSGPSNWSSTFQSYLTSNFNLWKSDVIGTAGITIVLQQMVNVSYYSGFTPVQNPVTRRWRNVPNQRAAPIIDVILNSTTNLIPGAQRRRMLHSA